MKKTSRRYDIEKFQVTRMELFAGIAGITFLGFFPTPQFLLTTPYCTADTKGLFPLFSETVTLSALFPTTAHRHRDTKMLPSLHEASRGKGTREMSKERGF